MSYVYKELAHGCFLEDGTLCRNSPLSAFMMHGYTIGESCNMKSSFLSNQTDQDTSNKLGKGNGNPLQCSCLENPRDGEAWWAAVYGVAQSWTQLKRLSSSSNKLGIKTWGNA